MNTCKNCEVEIQSGVYCPDCFDKSEICPDCGAKGIIKEKHLWWSCSDCGAKFYNEAMEHPNEIQSFRGDLILFAEGKYFICTGIDHEEGDGWFAYFYTSFGDKTRRKINYLFE